MVVLQALAGAAAAELTPELKDFSKDGIAFFNNIRTPAALLAASALKDAFVLQGKELPPRPTPVHTICLCDMRRSTAAVARSARCSARTLAAASSG